MSLLRNLLHRRRIPSLFTTPRFPHRPITSSLNTHHSLHLQPQTEPNHKPLHALFTQALGLSPQTQEEPETTVTENKDLHQSLKKLEEEVRIHLQEKKSKGVVSIPKKVKKPINTVKLSLYAAFTNKPEREVVSVRNRRNVEEVKVKEPMVVKELSPDMEMFVKYLYENGYFKDANFAKGKERFDLAWFDSFFGRGYIKFAAQRFGRENQEISKWLSASALKQLATFGCPSVDRSSVFPAKSLRKFFEVPENTVCSKCALQQSCKFVNQSVWKTGTNNLHLVAVMKVVTSYALELVHPQLAVPDEVKKSVSQLLKEVVKLSQTNEVASGI
ncbi:hypothetical protein Lal_00017917 [Lupinus albus]|uniref:Uncharacterized protein n=1 Tax=Lupinus albus TaxID=3870 RepID=A0A6A4NEN8_LUPAL|nr:hypothetical protein Lalb_Chr25g0285711 [Lupinus albus]KAF1866534.1 hypothetical protein Lal_00017917 [Lupinus albus]